MRNNRNRDVAKIAVICGMMLVFAMGSTISAQTSIKWDELKTGPYDVGFKTIEKYDYSRVFRAKYDYFGVPLEGERARPIQICIWYPAKANSDQVPMVYGEYSFPYPENNDFFDHITRLQNRERNYLFGLFNPNQGLPLDIMSVNMTAKANAPAADGQFPLIIYSPNLMGIYSENALLCEYLAGHGYVIVTTHSVGTLAGTPVTSQGDLETLISDKEFILANTRDLPFVDKNKLGLIGTGFGGLESLLLAMRNPDVDAMVSLRGIFIYNTNFEFIRQCPYYAIGNLSVPFLQIYPPGTENLDLSLFESLKYSPRYSAKFKKFEDRDFSSYSLISSLVPGIEVQNLIDKKAGYEMISRQVLEFFNAYLKKDDKSMKFLNKSVEDYGVDSDFLTMTFMPKQDLPPTQDQFMAIIQDKGVPTAYEIYTRFIGQNRDHVFFLEAPFNFLGYQYLQRNQVDDAVTIFKMNTEAYPYSCNVWDSYADGLTARGDSLQVREVMRKALEIMATDTITNEQTKEAIRAHADQVLGTPEN